jgi:hypothetical protein
LPQQEGVVDKVTCDSIEMLDKKTNVVTVFPAHDALAAGKVHEGTRDTFGYRLKDVKVNDVVLIGVATEGGKQFCAEICIRERPGGEIPESQSPAQRPYHLKRQAEIDAEQKGIPVPANLRSWSHGMTAAQMIQVLEARDRQEAAQKGNNPKPEKKSPENNPKK